MRHQRLALTLSTAALIAGTACSALFAAPTTALDNAPAGVYTLDKSHVNIIFNLSHMGFSRYFGRFDSIDGKIDFNPKSPETSPVTITVDIASIDTNNTKLQDELKSPQWFDAAKFPTATFTSLKLEKTNATTGKLYGDLTLHGITKPIVLDVTFNGAGPNPLAGVDELGFSAQTTIKRSEFGISQYIPMVGDDVTLTIEAEFHHKK